jgi:hypothetical protein
MSDKKTVLRYWLVIIFLCPVWPLNFWPQKLIWVIYSLECTSVPSWMSRNLRVPKILSGLWLWYPEHSPPPPRELQVVFFVGLPLFQISVQVRFPMIDCCQNRRCLSSKTKIVHNALDFFLKFPRDQYHRWKNIKSKAL